MKATLISPFGERTLENAHELRLDAIKAGSTPADLTNEVASVQADIDALKGINVPAAPAADTSNA